MDVDAGQVVHDDQRQRCGRRHKHKHDKAQGVEQIFKAGLNVLLIRKCGDRVIVDELLRKRLLLCAVQRIGQIGGDIVELRVRAEDRRIDLLGHIDIMEGVVFRNGGHRHVDGVGLIQPHDDGIADVELERPCQLIADHTAVLRQMDQFARLVVAQINIVRQRVSVVRHKQIRLHQLRIVRIHLVAGGVEYLHIRQVCRRDFGLGTHKVQRSGFTERQIVAAVGHDLHIIAEDAVLVCELFLQTRVDGFIQTEGGNQQRRATQNTDDSHDKAFFVAEHVAERDFPCKGQRRPQRRESFEENALAALGCLWPHQR